MTVPSIPKSGKGIAFKRVTKSFNSSGGARRDEPKIAVSKSGASRGNIEGKELMMGFMQEQGANPNDFEISIGGDEATGQLALYAPQPGDMGLMKVTLHQHSIHFHAGGAFKEFPKLRPATTVDCHIERTVDANGVPCLAINVLGGTPTRTVKRKASGAEKKE